MAIMVPIRIQLSKETSFLDLIVQVRQTTLEAYGHIRSVGFVIPMFFLHRTCRQDYDRFFLRGKELAIRFFTWLLTRFVFLAQAYPTLIYTGLMAIVTIILPKNGSRGKIRDTKGDTSFTQNGMEVLLNVQSSFHQTFSTSKYIYSD